jgi:hypothetical protein
MASLLRDIRRGASPKAEGGQQMMEVGQGGDGHPRCAEPQSRAGDRVEHPPWYDSDHPRSRLDIDDVAARRPFAAVAPQALAMQRVPAVVDDDLRPDMGRMTVRLPSAGSRGGSPGRIAAASEPRPCIRSS